MNCREYPKMCRTANMSWRTCVVVKQTQFHSIPIMCDTSSNKKTNDLNNLAPPDRYKHLKRAEEVAMTRLRIGHCKATKGHIVSRGPPAVCHHCGSTLSKEHILLECGTVQELRGEFYEADSLTSLFECVRPLAIIEYLKEAGFFYLIWQVYESEKRNVKSHKPQNPDYHIIEEDKWIAENIQKCVGRLICLEGRVVVKQTQFHSIPIMCDTSSNKKTNDLYNKIIFNTFGPYLFRLDFQFSFETYLHAVIDQSQMLSKLLYTAFSVITVMGNNVYNLLILNRQNRWPNKKQLSS